MNISKTQQRVLHVLAQGGRIQHQREGGRLVRIDCITREGMRLEACDLSLFAKLKAQGWIASREGKPYRITRAGLTAVRSQLDNR